MPSGGFCARCLGRPPVAGDVTPAFDYRFPVDRLVHRFKFGGDLALGDYLGHCLAQAVRGLPRPDLVIASPASAARLRERGFNPAGVLAHRVARSLGIEWDPLAIRKVRHTPPQTGLGRAERRRNLRGAFACRRDLSGLRVAVVDDVITTGATLEAIARELRRAGAAGLSGWVVARTPGPKSGA